MTLRSFPLLRVVTDLSRSASLQKRSADDTSWSIESLESSPSTTAVTSNVVSVITPLSLSRKAMSAASRPMAMRTSVCHGASNVPSTTLHCRSMNAAATAWQSIGDSPGGYSETMRAGTFTARRSTTRCAKSQQTLAAARGGRPRYRSGRSICNSAGRPPARTPFPITSSNEVIAEFRRSEAIELVRLAVATRLRYIDGSYSVTGAGLVRSRRTMTRNPKRWDAVRPRSGIPT